MGSGRKEKATPEPHAIRGKRNSMSSDLLRLATSGVSDLRAHVRFGFGRLIALSFVLAFAAASVLATAPGAEPHTVQGQVVDAHGAPIEGAEVAVRYQSNPGGVSISRSTRTDEQGRYRIDLTQPPGIWTAHASFATAIGGGEERITLTPDEDSPFAGIDGAVRNFRLAYDAPSTDSPSGAGGMLVVAAAIGDATPLDSVTVILTPVAGGPSSEHRLRRTGDGHVITGLEPRPYRVRAFHDGQALEVSPALTPVRGYAWSKEYAGDFERTGPGIFQLRVEVRSP